jgi:peroxin-14
VYPIIAPPTAPQLEQDKQAIDEQFGKAFSLLEQLSKDTDALKVSEQERTERLDAALSEVEEVIGELKTASRRREEEARRMSDEVRGLKDLIPKAMEGQKETTDTRLRELNTELKSLKTLMSQRLNPQATSGPGSYVRPTSAQNTQANTTNITNGSTTSDKATPKPVSVSSGSGTEAAASGGRSGSPFGTGLPAGKAAIPAWQLAAANKSAASGSSTSSTNNGLQEASGSAWMGVE